MPLERRTPPKPGVDKPRPPQLLQQTMPSTRPASLLPLPRKIEWGNTLVTLSPDTVIVADDAFLPQAELLACRLRSGTGWPWPVLAPGLRGEAPAIVLRHTTDIPRPEAYRLETNAREILLAAADPAGAFYAGQTLLQLLPPAIFCQPRVPVGTWAAPGTAWTLPAVAIEDWPEFRWRGVLLDSARRFQPVAWLKKFIEVLAQHKINVLHWHLTDDQGWRIEIKKHPRLAAVGSRRPESWRDHLALNAPGDGRPVEGFYRQDEIRELVAFALAHGVNILPEIEMPGHAQAAITAYPELGCTPVPPPVSTRLGVHGTLFNTRPKTLAFLRDVLAEVADLFPFEYLHIGGDEAVKDQWKNDPATQARIRELGLRDEDALQSWFIGQMSDFLSSRGKKLVGWDEIIEGGLVPGATVMSWRGREGAIHAATAGHDTVMCDSASLYFDFGQSPDPLTEPLSIGGCTPLRKVYETCPIPAELEPTATVHHVIGVQGQLWTGYMPTTDILEYMAFPRVCALAELCWTDPKAKDYADFTRRLARHLKRLDCQGIRYRPPNDQDM